MPQWRQKRCFAAPVLKVYSTRSPAPESSRKRAAGTIRCRKPPMRQIEQLQSSTCRSRGASTSKRTRPQWQLPTWVANGVDGRAETGIRPVYRSMPVAALGLALRLVRSLAGLVSLVVALAGIVVAVQRPRPALVDGGKPVLQAVELVRTRLDAHALGQRAPALAMVAFPLLGDVAAGTTDDLRDRAGVVNVARRPALLHEQRGDVIARRAVVAHEFVDERFAIATAVVVDVAQGLVDPDVAGAGIPPEHEILRAGASDGAGKNECEDKASCAYFHRGLQWFSCTLP